jgi:hypothetical protein
MRIRNIAALIGSMVALSASVAVTWTGASGVSNRVDNGADPATGIGETLLLVVADVTPRDLSADRLATLNESFGEVQGFYADPAAGYELVGALLQTSADLLVEPCSGLIEPLTASIQLDDPDCPPGGVAKILQPVTTTHVGLADLNELATAALCERSGDSCGLDRIKQLLGDDHHLDASSLLLATAFRTKRGAQEFLELARVNGIRDLVTLQVRKLSGGDVGLGQEPAPDGSGPLTGPLPDQEIYQR